MKDILLKLYELNERYHDTKEKMAWLGSSLYAAFSLAILRIFFAREMQDFINDYNMLFFVFLLLVFICAEWFINFQYKKKRISVRIDEELKDKMSEQVSSNEDQLKQIFTFISNVNTYWRNYKNKDSRYLSTEIPINILIAIFFIIQILMFLR